MKTIKSTALITNSLLNIGRKFDKNTRDFVGFIDMASIHAYIRLVVWLLCLNDKKQFSELGNRIISIWRQSGSSFLVVYLKHSCLCIQHYVSGNPLHVVEGFPIGLQNGLPTIVPGILRLKIKALDPLTIRAVLTVLSVYRVIKCVPQLKLSTISNPFTGISRTLDIQEINNILGVIKRDFKPNLDLSKFVSKTLLTSTQSGPNYPLSGMGYSLDAFALSKKPIILENLFTILKKTKNYLVHDLLINELRWVMDPEQRLLKDEDSLLLGKLSTKLEAAGKVRVFAILDAWTQTILYPIHIAIFKILSKIPQDGTFDQDRPIRVLMNLLRESDSKDVYSFDLSAATDRLPIDCQVQILSQLFNDKQLAEAWKTVLIGRSYTLRSKGFPSEELTYSVGQPMGALSSWAMLALTHHVIVQIAARRVTPGLTTWFDRYALLGDDIVIADKSVSKAYLSLMDSWLGVTINLSKSLQSEKGVIEFAKRLVSPEAEYTPIGPKNILMCLRNPMEIPSLFLDAYNKGLNLSPDTIVDQFKSLSIIKSEKKKIDLLWTVVGPFGFINTVGGLADSMKLTNSLNTVRFNILLTAIDDVIHMNNVKRWVSDCKSALSSLGDWDRMQVPGFSLSDIGFSPSFNHLRDYSVEQYLKLIQERPVRRYIYDAPLGFGIYNPNFLEEIVPYISKKVKDLKPLSSVFSPLKDESAVSTMRRMSKSRTFFGLVRENEQERVQFLRGNNSPFLGVTIPLKRNYSSFRRTDYVSKPQKYRLSFLQKVGISTLILWLIIITFLLLKIVDHQILMVERISILSERISCVESEMKTVKDLYSIQPSEYIDISSFMRYTGDVLFRTIISQFQILSQLHPNDSQLETGMSTAVYESLLITARFLIDCTSHVGSVVVRDILNPVSGTQHLVDIVRIIFSI